MSEQEHGSLKTDIVKIVVSAVLFLAAEIITNIFEFDTVFNILIFAVPYLTVGYEVLLDAAKGIIKGEVFGEAFLMSIATIGAFAIGEYPEAVFVMLFFAVGEILEHIAEGKSRSSIKKLMDVRPDKATVIRNEEVVNVSPETVSVGEIILVSPGERISLDGIVFEGKTSVDVSAITGESIPVEVDSGDSVFGGCVNLSGVIKVKVTKEFFESTISKILSLAETAASKKAKVDRFITKFATIYTPAVVIAAVLTAVVPSLITGEYLRYIKSALTFLVVSCPCAIVVSVPLTFFGGIGCSSRHGVLIKGADALEKLCSLKKIAFDKTGTLTEGKFEVVAVHPNVLSERELLRLASAAERHSTHPISLSIKNAAKGSDANLKVSDVKEISGYGVSAVIDGKNVTVGNGRLMQESGISYKECHHNGTVVHITCENEYYGHIVVNDVLKSDSRETVDILKQSGIETFMFTGDSSAAAKEIAEKTGVDNYCFGMLPQDKVKRFEEIIDKSSKNICAFAGDGINDAPVLARADIGIAMGALGSDAAIDAADIVLMDDNLKKIPLAMKIAKRTKRIALENIIFSLLVKFSVLLLAFLGVSQIMWFAAFADVGVLVLAVLNSARALRLTE